LVTATITLYVVLGGMRGATMNQIIQFWVLWLAIFAVAVMAWAGGMSYGKVLSGIDFLIPVVASQESPAAHSTELPGEGDRIQPPYRPGGGGEDPAGHYLGPGGEYTLLQALSLLVALMCGTAGLPHVLIRLYTNPDRARARWSVVMVLVLIGTFYLVATYLGLVMRHALLLTQTGGGTLGQPALGWLTTNGENLAVPAGALHFGGQVGLGIAVAGALAAVLSTMAGLLVVMSAALGHDLYYTLYNPEADDRTRVRVARASTVLMGLLTFLLALSLEDMQIAVLVGLAFAISASTLFPVLVSGLWWRRMTSSAAVAGMVTGLGASLLLIFAKPLLPSWLQFQNPGGLSMAVSFLAIYAVSLVDGRVPADVDRFMSLVHGTQEERRLRAAGLLKSRNLFADLRGREQE
jgi:cation/acetate symporter